MSRVEGQSRDPLFGARGTITAFSAMNVLIRQMYSARCTVRLFVKAGRGDHASRVTPLVYVLGRITIVIAGSKVAAAGRNISLTSTNIRPIGWTPATKQTQCATDLPERYPVLLIRVPIVILESSLR